MPAIQMPRYGHSECKSGAIGSQGRELIVAGIEGGLVDTLFQVKPSGSEPASE